MKVMWPGRRGRLPGSGKWRISEFPSDFDYDSAEGGLERVQRKNEIDPAYIGRSGFTNIRCAFVGYCCAYGAA